MQQLGRLIGLVLAIASLQLGQLDREPEATSEPVVMQKLHVSALETGYGLPVVAVADVPPEILARRVEDKQVIPASVKPTCPFDVRAIVTGDEQVGSFATVVADGESSIVRSGTRPEFGGQRWKIKSIDNDDVVVERGGRTLRCPLGQ